ncbi:MAG: hypothetical protein HYU59_05990 [Magnetospirillum gryphiswaldense]|nr:hypothetical protein [Magnetospirillum gryphiswaldense]
MKALWSIVGVVVVGLGLFVTNPTQEAHRQAFVASKAKACRDNPIASLICSFMTVEYRNGLLFSTGYVDGKMATFGIAGQVIALP